MNFKIFAAGGALCLAACSTGSETYSGWELEQLSAEEGFSLHIPERVLEPGEETQDCYFVRVPDLDNGKPINVERVHLALNPGSHHLNVFRVKTIHNLKPEDGEAVKIGPYDAVVVRSNQTNYKSPCWTSSNWTDWPLVANSQNSDPEDPYTDWRLPQDVTIVFQPGELLMVQPHFVNTTTQKTPHGLKAAINFHRYKGEAEPMELGTLFASQQSIRICRSNATPTFSGTCKFPSGGDVTITAANGHFHSRGKKFSMYTWDGVSASQPTDDSRFYVSNTWNDPPMMRGLDVQPPTNGGIWWSCEYQWHEPEIGCDAVNKRDEQHADDCCYTFGAGVDTQEHCNAFIYYYPRLQNTDVFCN